MWTIKVCLITLFITIAQSQFVINNDANSNFYSVGLPHAHVNFQRFFNGAGGQRVALQVQQQPHAHAHLYNTPLTHYQQLQSINHAHVPHAHLRLSNAPIPTHEHFQEHVHEAPQHHHHIQSHSAPLLAHHHHANPIQIKFSPSSDVSSVAVSNGGIEYKF